MNRYGIRMARMEVMGNIGIVGRVPSFEELPELVPGKWSDFKGVEAEYYRVGKRTGEGAENPAEHINVWKIKK